MQSSKSSRPQLKGGWLFSALLILYFPLFHLIPFPEPYIQGGEILFWGMGLLSYFQLFYYSYKNQKKIFVSFWEEKVHIILSLIFFHSLIFKKYHLAMTLLSVLSVSLNVSRIFTGSQGCKSSNFREMLLRLIVTSFVLQNMAAVCEFYVLKNGFLLFGHVHFYGSWYLLFLPVIWYSLSVSPKPKSHLNMYKLALILFSVCSGFIINSTLFWTLLILNFYVFALVNADLKKRTVNICNIAAVLACIGLLMSRQDQILNSIGERLAIWKLCLAHFETVPFFGVGAGGFEAWFLTLRNATLMRSPATFTPADNVLVEWAHNEWFQLFVEFGVLGCVMFSILVCYVIFSVFRGVAGKNSVYIVFLGCVSLIIQSLFFFPLRIPFVALSWLILVLFLLKYNALQGQHSVVNKGRDRVLALPKQRNIIFWSVVLSVGMFSLGFILKHAAGHYYLSKGLNSRSRVSKQTYLRQSIRYLSDSKIAPFALGKVLLDFGAFDEARFHFKQSFDMSPNMGSLFAMAVCEDLKGNSEVARDLYERLRRINPLFLPVKHNLETLLLRMEDVSESMRVSGMRGKMA